MCKHWRLDISENLLLLTTWSDLLTTLLACPLVAGDQTGILQQLGWCVWHPGSPFFPQTFDFGHQTGHGAVLDHEVCTSRDGGDLPQELQGLELVPKGHCCSIRCRLHLLNRFNLPATWNGTRVILPKLRDRITCTIIVHKKRLAEAIHVSTYWPVQKEVNTSRSSLTRATGICWMAASAQGRSGRKAWDLFPNK